MTIREGSVCRHIHCKVKRDVLVQLLWHKTTAKKRRELALSARTSCSGHVSRKLLLEEHKLEMRLEQIERERRHFINQNNNEKYMLQLSIRSLRGPERGQQDGDRVTTYKCPIRSPEPRPYTILRSRSEGNKLYIKPWAPASTTGQLSHNRSSVKQLRIKRAPLIRKPTEERPKLKSPLSWKQDYAMPQAPPPSRTPSKTDLFFTCIKKALVANKESPHKTTEFLPNSYSSMDGKKDSLQFEMDCHVKEDTAPTHSSFPNGKYATLNYQPVKCLGESSVKSAWVSTTDAGEREYCLSAENTDITASTFESKVERNEQERIFKTKLRQETIQEESTRSVAQSELQHNNNELLKPCVTGLQVSRKTDDTFRRSVKPSATSFEDERAERNDKVAKHDEENELEIGERRKMIDHNQEDTKNASDSQKLVSGSQGIGSDRESVDKRRVDTKVSDDKIGIDRVKIAGKEAIAGCKVRRHRKVQETRAKPSGRCQSVSSTRKGSRQENIDKIGKTKSTTDLQKICVQAKRLVTSAKSKTTSKRDLKISLETTKFTGKTGDSGGVRSGKSFRKKLSKQRCPACCDISVQNLASHGMNFPKNEISICAEKRELPKQNFSVPRITETKTPLSILLPSQSQVRGFDMVAKKRLRDKLMIQTRRHGYTGASALKQRLEKINKRQPTAVS